MQSTSAPPLARLKLPRKRDSNGSTPSNNINCCKLNHDRFRVEANLGVPCAAFRKLRRGMKKYRRFFHIADSIWLVEEQLWDVRCTGCWQLELEIWVVDWHLDLAFTWHCFVEEINFCAANLDDEIFVCSLFLWEIRYFIAIREKNVSAFFYWSISCTGNASLFIDFRYQFYLQSDISFVTMITFGKLKMENDIFHILWFWHDGKSWRLYQFSIIESRWKNVEHQ